MKYLPTFTTKMAKMQVNIPYMEHLGWDILPSSICLSLPSMFDKTGQYIHQGILLKLLTISLLGSRDHWRWWKTFTASDWVSTRIVTIQNPCWLVVEQTPLKNMKVSWDDYSQYMEQYKSCSKPPTSLYLLVSMASTWFGQE